MEIKQKHPIEEVITDTLKNIKNIIEIDTIIGTPIKTENNNIVIPVSKVSVGYVGGGGEYYDTKIKKIDHPFALGSGAGMSIEPIGFLIEEKGIVRYVETGNQSNLYKFVNTLIDTLKSFKLKGDKNESDN